MLFSLSLTPSLLPRTWWLQGIVSGLAAAVGYAFGALIGATLGHLPQPPISARARSAAWMVLAAVAVVVPGWCLVANFRWQTDVRRLMSMSGWSPLDPLAVVLTTLLVAYVLVVAGRLVRAAYRALDGLLSKLQPAWFGLAAKLMVPALLLIAFFDMVVIGTIAETFDEAYIAADARLDAGVDRPDSHYRSGGTDSLVRWDALGRQGRQFVAGGPTVQELESFSGRPAVDPIRVYSGLASAESLAERSDLAVAELDRTGAFTRRVIVVITTTGTGWVDPQGIDPLEYMYNGDTAAVAIQYSYLPSWSLMIGNQELARQAGRSLFEAVKRRWEQEPESSRPRVLLYGESLGVFGAASAFSDLSEIRRRTDGVLWVGPPRAARFWKQLTDGRDTGSQVWRPVYRQGETVRFGRDGSSLREPGGVWREPRIVYLQHSSDPITWWTPELIFNRPEWMVEPRGPDVSGRMYYLPVATFFQIMVDLVVSSDVTVGHGHRFGSSQAEAWALIAPPDGWSLKDTNRLVDTLGE